MADVGSLVNPGSLETYNEYMCMSWEARTWEARTQAGVGGGARAGVDLQDNKGVGRPNSRSVPAK
jgi:hypothetical protein